jgi:hypothetical protein
VKTSELLHLQALKLKREVTADNPDFDHGSDAPLWLVDTYSRIAETRNICAHIPVSLFDEIERLSGLLKISKRAVIEMSLRDFAVSANQALDDVGFVASSMTYQSIGDVPVDEA